MNKDFKAWSTSEKQFVKKFFNEEKFVGVRHSNQRLIADFRNEFPGTERTDWAIIAKSMGIRKKLGTPKTHNSWTPAMKEFVAQYLEKHGNSRGLKKAFRKIWPNFKASNAAIDCMAAKIKKSPPVERQVVEDLPPREGSSQAIFKFKAYVRMLNQVVDALDRSDDFSGTMAQNLVLKTENDTLKCELANLKTQLKGLSS